MHMRKSLSAAFLMTLCGASTAFAVPARPEPVKYTQPDGSVIMVRIEGDEFSHRYFTADNTPLRMDADGFLKQASLDDTVESLTINNGLARPLMRAAGVKSDATFTRKGNVRACVILVEFSDVKFSTPNPQQYFNRWLNEEGFSENSAPGSVRDYFINQSEGQFIPHFDVYGPVTMSYTRAKNSSSSNAYKVIHDAAGAIDSYVDFADYDVNGDGDVDNVYVIIAGQAGNNGGTNSFWPHNTTCPTNIFQRKKVDGKTLVHYALCGELSNDGTSPDGMGTFIHEFGHVLGLPDLYDTNTQNDYTPGVWDVMDIGCYLDNGRRPCNYSAHERCALDWLTPVTIGSPASVRLPNMDDKAFCVKIETGRENDYYLLENRVKTRFDNYLYGNGGMLIWHIDAANSNIANKPNNNVNHLAVDLVRADNKAGMDTYDNIANDAWPGGTNNTSFTSSSSPAMTRWESSSGTNRIAVEGKPVTNIKRAADGTVSFDFMGGSSTNIISPDPVDLYTYTVSASPSQGGIVYIGSDRNAISVSFSKDQPVALHAEATQYYTLEKWTRNGEFIGRNATIYYSASEKTAGTYIAHFKRNDDAPLEYCYPSGNLNILDQFGDRYTSSITISDNAGSAETVIGTLQSGKTDAIYIDATSQSFATKAGATVTLTPSTIGAWMHTYLYIDWNGDGFNYSSPSDYLDPQNDYAIKPGADLVYYSNWCPTGNDPSSSDKWYSSTGVLGTSGNVHDHNPSAPITFTIPETVNAGSYRIRFKCHWCSLDPCGGQDSNTSPDNAIEKVGGIIADFTLTIQESEKYDITVNAAPETGGNAYINGNENDKKIEISGSDTNRSVTLNADAADGFIFKSWTHTDRNGTKAVVSSNPEYTIERVNAETDGTYSALFEMPVSSNSYPIPGYGTNDDYFLTSITSEGGYNGQNIAYAAAAHPGQFHSVLMESNAVTVYAGKSFSLHLTANDQSQNDQNHMRNTKAHIYDDWNATGHFGNDTQYGFSNGTNDNNTVMNISHKVNVPANTKQGLYYIRALYVHFSHNATTSESTDIDKGVSYDIPVKVLNDMSSLESDELHIQDTEITPHGLSLHIQTAHNYTTIFINDMTGRQIFSGSVNAGQHVIQLPSQGLYIVTINGETIKIAAKD